MQFHMTAAAEKLKTVKSNKVMEQWVEVGNRQEGCSECVEQYDNQPP